MWMKDVEYNGVIFHVFADWFGLDGLKICLSIGDPRTLEALNNKYTIIQGLEFFRDHAEEFMFVGWSGDEVFWHWMIQKDLGEQERIAKLIINSEFADNIERGSAQKHLDWVIEQKRRGIQKRTKQIHTRARRSQFNKEYDRLMLALIERDGYQCIECGTVEDLTIDHITPLSKGGTDNLENLRLLCRPHNSKKGDR